MIACCLFCDNYKVGICAIDDSYVEMGGICDKHVPLGTIFNDSIQVTEQILSDLDLLSIKQLQNIVDKIEKELKRR